MATSRKVSSPRRQYRTYGSLAYQPEFDGSAVRVPRREPQQQPQVRPRRHVVRRPQVQVREAGAFSPVALAGLLAVCVFAALLLISNAQLMVLKDQTVTLNAQLQTLQAEHASLLAQRELAYDLEAIETQLTASGQMVKPQSNQITYLNASEPDSVVVFGLPDRSLDDLFGTLRDFFAGLAS